MTTPIAAAYIGAAVGLGFFALLIGALSLAGAFERERESKEQPLNVSRG
jgi:hypothetical protein